MAPAQKWIWIILLAYVAGFIAFPPRVLLINDEERYVTQAVAFARGTLNLAGAPDADSTSDARMASDFPPGTSAVQAVFVKAGGWRAAAGLSVLSLVLLTILTGALLRAYGLQAGFALAIPAFFGALFFGRTAMSDVPAAALVAFSLLLLKRAEVRSQSWSFGAGVASGFCLLFREPVVLLLAPFIVGLGIRRHVRIAALGAGGLIGVAARLVVAQTLFSDAFYLRDSGYGFSIHSLVANLPQYALVLLVMFPLGGLLPFVYRGPNRPDVLTAFASYVLLFLLYDYNSWRESGIAKGTILGARFMIPALPLLVVMAADVCQRAYARFSQRTQGIVRGTLRPAYVCLALLAFGIHPLVRRLEAQPFSIMKAIQERTATDVPIVINERVVGKYVSPVYGDRPVVWRSRIQPADLAQYCRNHGRLGVVFLDRLDTELFRRDAQENATFLSEAQKRLTLRQTYDSTPGPGLQLKMFEAQAC